jgi:hypothetical protein
MSSNTLNQEVLNNFLVEAFIMLDRTEDARELLEQHSYLASHWRGLALKYSDKDDLDNAIYSFRRSYESGDLKSLPWLVELLSRYFPNDNSLPDLQTEQSTFVKAGDSEVIFSLGNIQLVSGNFVETYRLWQPFVGKNLWIFDRNLYFNLLQNPDETIAIAHREFGHLSNRAEIINCLVELYSRHWLTEPDALEALLSLLVYYSSLAELESNSTFTLDNLFNMALHHAKKGNFWSLYSTLIFANGFGFDCPALYEFVETSGLTEVLQRVDLYSAISDKTSPASAKFQSFAGFGNQKHDIQKIFNKAQAAQNEGDVKAEISAWVEGAKLGNVNCFYNIGVTIGKELGIVCNYFGCTGGEGEIWGELAKGIQMDDIRTMESEIHYLNESLLQPVIRNYRTKFKLDVLGSTSNLTEGSLPNMTKLKDLLEFIGFKYVELSDTTIALPYAKGDQSLINFVELVNDNGKEVFLIHSPLLITRIGSEGRFVSPQTGITKLEEKLIRIVIRGHHLIFPNMGIWLSDIFASIPEDRRPNIFLNSMQAHELWRFIGNSQNIFVEPIPTTEPFNQIDFGYAVDASLVSDHLETAVKGSISAIIGVVTTVSKMQQDSKEMFDLMFNHDATQANQLELVGLTNSEQLEKEVTFALLDKALLDLRDRNDNTQVRSLQDKGIEVASQIVLFVELNKKNLEFISDTLLRLSRHHNYDVEIRNALNNAGWIYQIENLNGDKATTCFEASARLGSANAMSNLSWRLMLQERFEEVIEVYERYYYRIMTTRTIPEDFAQAANFRSNVALCRWALGASKEVLNDIWSDEYFQERHAESFFYPILYDHLNGGNHDVKSRIDSLGMTVNEELRETFEDSKNNQGWFGEISRKALQLLEDETPK